MIRRASLRDSALFATLWEEYLKENEILGRSDVLATERSLRFFQRLFNLYTSGEQEGVVLFGADDNAVLMWGDAFLQMDMVWGRTAMGWGTYVRPDYRRKGWTAKMWPIGAKVLSDMGFDVILASAHNDNPSPLGAMKKFGYEPPYQTNSIYRLKDR